MKYSTKYINVELKEDIMWANFNDCEIGLTEAKAIIDDRLFRQNGRAYPAIIDIAKINKISFSARHFMAKEGSNGLQIAAIITSSPLSKVIANFFLLFGKPQIPTKTFVSIEEAEEWIWSEWSPEEYSETRSLQLA